MPGPESTQASSFVVPERIGTALGPHLYGRKFTLVTDHKSLVLSRNHIDDKKEES